MAAVDAPGVYVQEISNQPAAIVSVATAVPGFVGYTATFPADRATGETRPVLVTSMADFERLFGQAGPDTATSITFDAAWKVTAVTFSHRYQLHASMRLYFENGGGRCYVVSAGRFRDNGSIGHKELLAGLAALAAVDEVTLLVVPDAASAEPQPRAEVQRAMLRQAGERRDRFAILDAAESPDWSEGITRLREDIGLEHLKSGAAYTPWLYPQIHREISYRAIQAFLQEFRRAQPHDVQALFVQLDAAIAAGDSASEARLEQQLRAASNPYAGIIVSLQTTARPVPPSGAVAGIYAQVDNARGVWKAPADVAVAAIAGLTRTITKAEQDSLNVDAATGKSINAIRAFAGRGTLVFGARTLAGNDNEWRYVPVRRLATMIEESIAKGCRWAVFEPNDEPLWAKLRASVANYLTTLWRDGALQGTKPEQAFFVNIGRGTTMTDADIVAGKLIIEIGIAPLRPAEFIVIRISLAMTPASGAPAPLRPPQKLRPKS